MEDTVSIEKNWFIKEKEKEEAIAAILATLAESIGGPLGDPFCKWGPLLVPFL